jgi:5-(carboxyamino)imidazole ribonucleotide synthase
MGQLQDRLSQKLLLAKYNLESTDSLVVNSADELEAALTKFSGSLVLKQRRFGYDGYGTYIFKNKKSFEWQKLADKNQHGFIAEPLIKFKRELAIQIARNANGEFTILPLVETLQKDSRCFWVKGPVTHPGLNPLLSKIRKFLNAIDYCGLIAFELFDCGKKLLINEIAPRVHNSGHHSLNSHSQDQFSLHLKAVLNLPLVPAKAYSKGFAMLNLLGETSNRPSWNVRTPIHLHWYGKTENRPGRKMGHINALSSSANSALNIVLKAKKDFHL